MYSKTFNKSEEFTFYNALQLFKLIYLDVVRCSPSLGIPYYSFFVDAYQTTMQSV